MNLLLIAICVVIIVDISGFIDSVKHGLKRWLGIRGEITLKPFDCSLCLTHWVGLIYLLFTGITLQSYAILLFISVLTPTIASAILLFREILDFIIAYVSKKLG